MLDRKKQRKLSTLRIVGWLVLAVICGSAVGISLGLVGRQLFFLVLLSLAAVVLWQIHAPQRRSAPTPAALPVGNITVEPLVVPQPRKLALLDEEGPVLSQQEAIAALDEFLVEQQR